MKNRTKLLVLMAVLVLLSACDGREVMKTGQIRLELVVYNDPDGNLYDSFQLPISTLWFVDNIFLEQVSRLTPDIRVPAYALIRDSVFAPMDNWNSSQAILKFYPLKQKRFGAAFLNISVPCFDNREQLNDTVLSGMFLKRFQIVTPEEYSVFYLHPTDTVIPYSLSRQFDKEYDGIVVRIDTYERKRDRFLSLRMTYQEGVPQRYLQILKR